MFEVDRKVLIHSAIQWFVTRSRPSCLEGRASALSRDVGPPSRGCHCDGILLDNTALNSYALTIRSLDMSLKL